MPDTEEVLIEDVLSSAMRGSEPDGKDARQSRAVATTWRGGKAACMRTLRLSLITAAILALALGLDGPAAGQSEAPLDPMAANHWAGTWTYIEDSSTSVGESTGPTYNTSRGEVTADDPRMVGTMTEVWNTLAMASGESG